MKKLFRLLLLVTLTSIFFTGCSLLDSETTSSSSMIRSVGVGEAVMPIDPGSFAIEFFNDEAITVDYISETSISHGLFEPSNHYISGGIVTEDLRYYGLNSRFGVNNRTEVKLGIFTGSIENGYSSYTSTSVEGDVHTNNTEFYTTIKGFNLGFKRLLTDYNDSHRLSLYLDGKYLSMKSDDSSEKYDGINLEFKSALIYGFLPNPEYRNYPSLSAYYSMSNSERDETIFGVPKKRSLQVVGLEANYTFTQEPLYTTVFIGAERELEVEASNDINPYFGAKVGFHFKNK